MASLGSLVATIKAVCFCFKQKAIREFNVREVERECTLTTFTFGGVSVGCVCASRPVTLLSGGSARPRESARVCRRVRGSRDLRGTTVYSHLLPLSTSDTWASRNRTFIQVRYLKLERFSISCSSVFFNLN
jgi:hypothetical protein